MSGQLKVLCSYQDPTQTQFPVETTGQSIPELIKECMIGHDQNLDLTKIVSHVTGSEGMCQLLQHSEGMVIGEVDDLLLSNGKKLPHISDVITLMKLEPHFPLLVIVPGATVSHLGEEHCIAIHISKDSEPFLHTFPRRSRINSQSFQILARCA
ncbi:hypothetical protein KKA15_02990 [Patescibacteria group bacterium]|nr:hypothetical protein [Patescibacteria group bacterium]